ncbi:MAG: hypothetical protein GX306_02965 [Clostridiales bacterium]|nr:hypothetical protein [Clostridiales bacterium]
MRKIKRTVNKKDDVRVSQKRPIFLGLLALVILLTIVFIFIENREGKTVIRNATDTKLEYVKAYFVDAQGPLHEGYLAQNLEPGKSWALITGENKLLGTEANLEVLFKFEGSEEVFVDAGYFNDSFDGNITIDFNTTDEKDIIKLHVKASNGLLSSRLIDCDDEFMIDLVEGEEIE